MLMLILGILQFVIILMITIFEYKNKSPVVFLWATLFIMFGVMHMINSFSGDYEYSDAVLSKASLLVIGYCIIYYIIRYVYIKNRSYTTRQIFDSHTITQLDGEKEAGDSFLFLIFVFAMASKLIPYIRYVGGIFTSSWSTGRDYAASLDYFNFNQIANIVIYSLSGLIALFYIRRDKKWIVVSNMVLFSVLLTRNRIEILPLVCSFLAVYFFKRDKLNIKTLVFGLIASFFVIYIVYALRVFRHYGTVQDFIASFNFDEFNSKIKLYLATSNGELGLRRYFYYFISRNNQFRDFGKMHSYIRMLLVYIPTSWSFGLKPNDFAISMGQAIGMGAGGSTHPTLFGDCFANLDVFGFLLGAFWAMYACIVDSIIVSRKSKTNQVLLYVLNAVVYVIIGRGSVYNGFWFVAYGMPLLIFIEWFMRNTKITKYRIVIRKNK